MKERQVYGELSKKIAKEKKKKDMEKGEEFRQLEIKRKDKPSFIENGRTNYEAKVKDYEKRKKEHLTFSPS
jgi:hypothetical protein